MDPFGILDPGLLDTFGVLDPGLLDPFGVLDPGLLDPFGVLDPGVLDPFGVLDPGLLDPFGVLDPGVLDPFGVYRLNSRLPTVTTTLRRSSHNDREIARVSREDAIVFFFSCVCPGSLRGLQVPFQGCRLLTITGDASFCRCVLCGPPDVRTALLIPFVDSLFHLRNSKHLIRGKKPHN